MQPVDHSNPTTPSPSCVKKPYSRYLNENFSTPNMKYAGDKKDWFIKFKAGNNLAFKYYFDEYRQLIFYNSYKIVQDTAAAEDIASDTFQKLWEYRAKIETEDHIAAFLRRVSRNFSLNFIKHSALKTNVEEELRYLNEDLDSVDLANDLIANEATKKIYQAIDSLPGQCKAVFKLLYFEQASTKEVSQKLGITERNVLNQKARAIQLLRGILTGCLIIFYNFLLELSHSSLML